jgi:protein-L-isoaspartate(D-aspartate) O-methyltransferase
MAPAGLGLDSARRACAHGAEARRARHRDPRVLAAMGAVERHRFVDSALVNQAYEDTSLPIGLGQTISKPSVVARMIELLLGGRWRRHGQAGPRARDRHRLRLPGRGAEPRGARSTASSACAACTNARENLRPLRLANVHLLFGDGMLGYAKGAPYAGIIAAAGGEAVPAMRGPISSPWAGASSRRW